MLQRPTSSTLDWSNLAVRDGCTLIRFTSGKPLHIAFISDEAIEDATKTTNGNHRQLVDTNRSMVEEAINRAMERGDWEHCLNHKQGKEYWSILVRSSDFGIT